MAEKERLVAMIRGDTEPTEQGHLGQISDRLNSCLSGVHSSLSRLERTADSTMGPVPATARKAAPDREGEPPMVRKLLSQTEDLAMLSQWLSSLADRFERL
jgi:hypothetical protein